MSDLETSVIVNLAGNLENRARAYGRSLGQFSSTGRRHMQSLRRATTLAARGVDRIGNRYTALATTIGGAAIGRFMLSLEERMTRLGIQADISSAEVQGLTQEIFDVAKASDVRIDPSQLTGAVEEIVEKTGDLRFAKDNLKNLATAISATGAQGVHIGSIAAEFQKMGITGRQDVAEALDILTVQGKAGAFTLQNLATQGSRVVTAYTAMGRKGLPAIREMGAALQVIRQGTANAETASTAFEALLRTLTDKKKTKILGEEGIQVYDPEQLKQGKEVLRPINELLVEIVKAADGRKSLLQAFGGDEAGKAFNAIVGEFNRTGAIDSIEKFYTVQADGTTILRDSARAAQTGAATMRMLRASWMQLANEKLAQPLTDAVEALNSLDADAVTNTMKMIVKAGAAFIAMSAAGKVFRGARAATRFVRGSGVAGALGAGGATPVYVTNWPGAPGNAAAAGAAGGAAAKGSRLLRLAKGTGLVGLAAGGGALVGTGIDKGLQMTEGGLSFRDRVGEVVAATLAVLGNDDAQQAIDAEQRGTMNGALEIKLTSEPGTRASVTRLQSDNLDIDIDNGAALVVP